MRVKALTETKKEQGLRLKEARKVLRLTQKEFSEPLGMSWYQQKDLETGRTILTPTLAKLYESKYFINSEWVLKNIGEMFTADKNVLNTVDVQIQQIIKELETSPGLKDVFLKFIEARNGNKIALEEVKNILKGLELRL